MAGTTRKNPAPETAGVAPEATAEVPRRPSPAESSDPAVHHLLAQRQTHQLAVANAQADQATIADSEARLDAIHQQLTEMGY